MAQDDNFGALPNQARTSYRNAVNNCFQAVATQHSGSSEPPVTYANMIWFDTGNNLIKIRDTSNITWITIGAIPFLLSIDAIEPRSGLLNSATLSGTQGEILSIPPGIHSFDLTVHGVTLTTTADCIANIGTSAGYATTSYASNCEDIGGVPGVMNFTGYRLAQNVNSNWLGTYHFSNNNNIWTFQGLFCELTTNVVQGVALGTCVLPGVLDKLRIAISAGSFTGGIFSIRWYK